jgi:DNA gyrase subunit A
MSGEQKFKENDSLRVSFEAMNSHDLLVFTDRQQVYKAKLSDFDDTKASALGTYLPTKLSMDEGEKVLTVMDPGDYNKDIILFFENGKAARIALSAYATKTNRKKLINAFSDKSPLVSAILLQEETNITCTSSDGRMLIFHSSLLATKTSKSTQGVGVMTLKKQKKLEDASLLEEKKVENVSRYRVKTIPAAGAILKPEDRGEQQMSLLDDKT